MNYAILNSTELVIIETELAKTSLVKRTSVKSEQPTRCKNVSLEKVELEILTEENIKVGARIVHNDHLEYGILIVGQDRNGYLQNGRSGSSMLFNREFKYYSIIK